LVTAPVSWHCQQYSKDSMDKYLRGFIVIWFLAGALSARAGEPVLVETARQGDIAAVQSLILEGMDVNTVASDGTTALAHAAYRNDAEMVKYLLSADADTSIINDYGAGPLYLAAAEADAALVNMLLETGTNPDTALLSGETPLMVAASRGRTDVVKSLLDHGADPNAAEYNSGQTALMWAVARRHAAVAALLVEYKAEVGAKSKGGFTPLMFAAQQGDVKSARVLLSAGAQVDQHMPGSGLTPLMVASASGFADVATVLLERNANPDKIDEKGNTPLHLAVRHTDVIRTLLVHGANPDRRLPKAAGRYLEGATPLILAAEINNIDAVKVLLDAGANPMITTAHNTTALMFAAGATGGSDVSEERTDVERATAIRTVRLLAEQGIDINAVGLFGWTALHVAAYQGLDDVIRYLVEQGADINNMDNFGQTPLSISYAVVTAGIGDAYNEIPRTYRKNIAELLLSLGATPLEKSGVIRVSARAGE